MQYKYLRFLLWSLIVHYPILKNWKCVIGKPIALIFDDIRQALPFIEKISPHPIIIDSSTKVKTVKEFLLNANSVGVFMLISNRDIKTSVKEMEKVNAIFSVANFGLLDGQEANAMTFLICERKVSDEYKESVLEIHIGTDIDDGIDNMFAFIPPAEQIAVIKDRVSYLERDEFLPFKAAVAFSYPNFNEMKDLKCYERMLAEAEMLVLQAEEYKEQDDITELVVEQFARFLEDNARDVFNFSELDTEIEQRFENIIIVKDNYLFMEDHKFKEIVEPLISIVPVDELKRQLHSVGFLQGSVGDYTVKLNYCIDGKFRRKRMLKFSLSDVPMLKSYLLG